MDISTATGRLMLAVIGAVGQAARWPCWSGNASGLQSKAQGHYKGRVPTAHRHRLK